MLVTKTMKYKIVKPVSCSWDVLGVALKDTQYEMFRIKNRVIQLYYEYQNDRHAYKTIHGVYPKDVDQYGCPFLTHVYRVIRVEFSNSLSNNVTSTIQKAKKLWTSSAVDILKGNKSIPSFRRNGSIELNAGSIRNFISRSNGDVELDLALLSNEGVKSLQDAVMAKKNKLSEADIPDISTTYRIVIDSGNGGSRAILNRIMTGEYKLCGSQILYKKTKKSDEWMLTLTYQFEGKDETLDPSRILGVDMGIVNPVYMAVNFNPKWRRSIEGGQIEKHRLSTEAKRRKLMKQAAVCGGARVGHGYAKRMRTLELLREKISNFRNSVNHSYAKRIVEEAVKLNCGVIQFEDLTGISEDDIFLGRWTYYDLQTKIASKAHEYGIVVRQINPSYTSQRCSECGHISPENRKNQAEFHCQVCEFKAHADFNAARNISMPDIEERIISQCKKQGLKYNGKKLSSA